MHFEVPKAKTFKEFGGEYVMIVVSIITALALEHAAQTWHRSHVAHEAVERIEAEVKANIAELDMVIAHNDAQAAQLNKQAKFLLEGIKAKVDDATLTKQWLEEEKGSFGLSIKGPTFKHEAWDVAVANQAVSWMDATVQERYAGAYASMRDVQALSNGGGIRFLDGAALRNVTSDLLMGEATPRAIYRAINQMRAATESMNGNLQILRRDLRQAAATAAAH